MLSEAIELAAANLSPQRIQVNVIGEVNSPGRLELMANTPLVGAILLDEAFMRLNCQRFFVDLASFVVLTHLLPFL